MTRFLLDESVDIRLRAFLQTNGHDVLAIGDDFPQALEDPEVLAIAVARNCVLVTNDRDFGDMIFKRSMTHSGVVYFRLRSPALAMLYLRMSEVLRRFTDLSTRFIVVTEHMIRVRD